MGLTNASRMVLGESLLRVFTEDDKKPRVRAVDDPAQHGREQPVTQTQDCPHGTVEYQSIEVFHVREGNRAPASPFG